MSVVESHFQRKVNVYVNLYHGILLMDRQMIQTMGQLVLAAGMLVLVYLGQVGGAVGIAGATITSGVDLAAIFEAWKQVRVERRE